MVFRVRGGLVTSRFFAIAKEPILVVTLFAALTAVMAQPFLQQAATHLRDLGDPLEYAWVLGYSADRLLSSPLDLYAGNVFYPFRDALAYSDSTIASTIIALPVLVATDNPVLATNLLILLSFVLAGTGAYLLAVDLTGSRVAGVVAGIIFAFNPYRMDHLGQIPNASSHWLPFVFLALNRFLSTGGIRWAAVFWGLFALQFLSSFYYAFAISLAVAVYVLGRLVWRPRRILRRSVILPMFVAGAVTAPLLLLVSLPYFEVSDAYGLSRGLLEAEFFSARPQSYLAVPEFNRTWGAVEALRGMGGPERNLFPGLLALILAGVGFFGGLERYQRVLFFLVGLAGFALSLGPTLFWHGVDGPVSLPFPMPYRVLHNFLPGFQSLRVPARFAIVVMLALSVLAAGGAALIARSLLRRAVATALPASALAVVLCFGMLVEYASFPVPMDPVPTGAQVPPVYRWLQAQDEKGVLVELPIDDEVARQVPYMYFSTYHGFTIVNGSRAFIPPGYRELASNLQTFPSEASLALLADLNARYVLVHAGQLDKWDWHQRRVRLERFTESVRLVERFGEDYLYAIKSSGNSPAFAVSLAGPRQATASQTQPVRLVLEAQGRRTMTLVDLPKEVPVLAEWLGADGRRLAREYLVAAPNPVVQTLTALTVPVVAPDEPGTYSLVLTPGAPLSAAAGPSPPLTVEVVAAAPLAGGQGGPPIAIEEVELLQSTVMAADAFQVRVRWRAGDSSARNLRAFVNLFDESFRVWSVDSRPLLGEVPAEGGWGAGEAVLDVRTVLPDKNTPPGYYSVEVGLFDPKTRQRATILGPDGRPVDSVFAGRLRVTQTYVPPNPEAAAEHPLRASLDGRVELLGWSRLPNDLATDRRLQVALYWQALAPLDRDLSVFLHVYDRQGSLVAQQDGGLGDVWPSSRWTVGDIIEQRHELHLPAGIPPGDYQLAVGVYDLATMRRLTRDDGQGAAQDYIVLEEFHLAR